jgi:hypothetical protein
MTNCRECMTTTDNFNSTMRDGGHRESGGTPIIEARGVAKRFG